MKSLYEDDFNILTDSDLFKTIYLKVDGTILFVTENKINFLLNINNLWTWDLNESQYKETDIQLIPPNIIYKNWISQSVHYFTEYNLRYMKKEYLNYFTVYFGVGDLELPIDINGPFKQEVMENMFLLEHLTFIKFNYQNHMKRYSDAERYIMTLKLLLVNALLSGDLSLFTASPLILDSFIVLLENKFYVLILEQKWYSFSLTEIYTIIKEEELWLDFHKYSNPRTYIEFPLDSIKKVEHINDLINYDVNAVIEKYLPYGSIEGQKVWFFFNQDAYNLI